MKSRFLRSLAVGLIGGFVLSSVPLFTNTALGLSQEPAAGTQPRRGKNGGSAPLPTPGNSQQGAVQGTTSESRREPLPADESQARVSNSTNAKPADDPGRALDELASSAGDPGQNAGGRRDGAPPFDRPPISSGGPDRAATKRRTDRSADANSKPAEPNPRDAEVNEPPPRRMPPDSPSAPGRSRDSGRSAPTSDSADPRSDSSTRRDRPLPELRRGSGSRSPQQSDSDPPRESPDTSRSRPSSPRSVPQSDDTDDVVRLDSTLVSIPLLVSDRAGRYVPQMSKRDFTLYEDGVAQEIGFFGSEEVPFNVALLLDVSPSVQASLEEIQNAAIEFVRQLRPQDRVMVVSFDRHVDYLTDFTNNRRELELAIRRTSTGSGTSVYDAVFETVTRELRHIEGRKALILFSDGEDTTSSTASYDEAVEAVAESDVLVYGLRYPGGSSGNSPSTRSPIPSIQLPFPFPWPWPRRRGTFADSNAAPGAGTSGAQRTRRNQHGDFMTDITSAGGGPVYDAEHISDLSRLAGRIAEELRHVYVLSYYPSNPLSNGGYREVRVRVNGRPDVAVRHRRGYEARDVNRKGHT